MIFNWIQTSNSIISFTHLCNSTHEYHNVNVVHQKYQVSLLTFEIPASQRTQHLTRKSTRSIRSATRFLKTPKNKQFVSQHKLIKTTNKKCLYHTQNYSDALRTSKTINRNSLTKSQLLVNVGPTLLFIGSHDDYSSNGPAELQNIKINSMYSSSNLTPYSKTVTIRRSDYHGSNDPHQTINWSTTKW